jgi:hypothetical protein
MALHGHPRPIKDLDLLLRPEDLPRALELLAPIGWDLRSPPVTYFPGTPRERTVYGVHRVEGQAERLPSFHGKRVLERPDREVDFCAVGATVDLITCAPALAEVWATRERRLLGRELVWVVSVEGLRHMKGLAGRLSDQADLDALARVATRRWSSAYPS